ncbi:PspC domain-containing protein [Micromonospora sp. NPDC050686]|uniref:PspC domain-containing protein n=1 Tax=Micromonospora sp. NPDC050686 TaxID=3154631 RepID=UPI0033FD806D
MTEEAARPPLPGAAPQDGPPPPPPAATPADQPGPAPGTGWATAPPPGPTDPPQAGDGTGTPGASAAGHQVPPGGYAPPGAGFTSRYGLVRPRDGRYLAGVCAAIGRATNTDPVLWRVILAVLGFFGGIGVLVYVAAWLIIPGEGDSASPIESMLGRGRSSMSPVTVIVLGILVAAIFGYIVTDAFRAVLLGAAILIGGALLLNRDDRRATGGPAPAAPPVPPTPPPGPVPPVSWPAPTGPAPVTAERPVSAEPATPGTAPTTPAEPVTVATAPPAPVPPVAEPAAWPPPAPVPPVTGPPPAPPPTGYRPPFAPRGPFAGTPQPPLGYAPTARPARPPKRPRERSPLGAVTFSLIFLALGVVALLDLLDVFPIGAAAYFAVALAVIGAGLLVGTWFGRARWLVALGLVTAAALGFATVAESYDRVSGLDGNVTWAPPSYRDLAVRYENSFGDAVLDLRAVTFDERDTKVNVVVNFGNTTVVVPPDVDVTAVADVKAGEATVFGQRAAGFGGRPRQWTDLGADGAGGGRLHLIINVNAGNLEVTR